MFTLDHAVPFWVDICGVIGISYRLGSEVAATGVALCHGFGEVILGGGGGKYLTWRLCPNSSCFAVIAQCCSDGADGNSTIRSLRQGRNSGLRGFLRPRHVQERLRPPGAVVASSLMLL
jgi:hypothetical protein